ncbi:MAG TPA: hypothetical protein VLH08_19580 [Acidobacteriota bacterium]|nr:hypothetical protein [Acidobacteriota bacterium]
MIPKIQGSTQMPAAMQQPEDSVPSKIFRALQDFSPDLLTDLKAILTVGDDKA